MPSGIVFDEEGTPLVVSMSEGTVERLKSGQRERVADLSPVFGAPSYANDSARHRSGQIYVGSMGYDVFAGEPERPTSLAMIDPHGNVSAVADDMHFPNGMVIVPSGRVLILAESTRGRLTAFDVNDNGTLTNRRVWAEFDGVPDGICLDAEGAIWFASFFKHEFVRVHEGGRISARISTGEHQAICCALGDDDGKSLYLGVNVPTASKEGAPPSYAGEVWKVRVEVGAP